MSNALILVNLALSKEIVILEDLACTVTLERKVFIDHKNVLPAVTHNGFQGVVDAV